MYSGMPSADNPQLSFSLSHQCLIAVRQHRVGEVDVFRDRLTGKSADLNQTIAAHDERGADAKRASPGVLGGLKDVEEKR